MKIKNRKEKEKDDKSDKHTRKVTSWQEMLLTIHFYPISYFFVQNTKKKKIIGVKFMDR